MLSRWNSVVLAMPPEAVEIQLFCQQGSHQWQTVGHFTQGKWHGHNAVDVKYWRSLPCDPVITVELDRSDVECLLEDLESRYDAAIGSKTMWMGEYINYIKAAMEQ